MGTNLLLVQFYSRLTCSVWAWILRSLFPHMPGAKLPCTGCDGTQHWASHLCSKGLGAFYPKSEMPSIVLSIISIFFLVIICQRLFWELLGLPLPEAVPKLRLKVVKNRIAGTSKSCSGGALELQLGNSSPGVCVLLLGLGAWIGYCRSGHYSRAFSPDPADEQLLSPGLWPVGIVPHHPPPGSSCWWLSTLVQLT